MVRPGMTWRGAVEGPRSRGDAQGKYSDEEDLEDIFKSWQQNTANRRITDDEKTDRGRQRIGDAQGKHSDGEDLEDIFASWHQKTANRRIIDDDKTEGNNEQRLQDLPPSDRPPATNRQIHDEEPMAKRQKTTVGRSRKRMRRQRRWLRAIKKRRPRPRKNARRCREGPLRLLSCQARVCQLVFYGASAHLMSVSLSRRWSSV